MTYPIRLETDEEILKRRIEQAYHIFEETGLPCGCPTCEDLRTRYPQINDPTRSREGR